MYTHSYTCIAKVDHTMVHVHVGRSSRSLPKVLDRDANCIIHNISTGRLGFASWEPFVKLKTAKDVVCVVWEHTSHSNSECTCTSMQT